jgi:hypothetical protein
MKPETERPEVNLEIWKSGRREGWEIHPQNRKKTWQPSTAIIAVKTSVSVPNLRRKFADDPGVELVLGDLNPHMERLRCITG